MKARRVPSPTPSLPADPHGPTLRQLVGATRRRERTRNEDGGGAKRVRLAVEANSSRQLNAASHARRAGAWEHWRDWTGRRMERVMLQPDRASSRAGNRSVRGAQTRLLDTITSARVACFGSSAVGVTSRASCRRERAAPDSVPATRSHSTSCRRHRTCKARRFTSRSQARTDYAKERTRWVFGSTHRTLQRTNRGEGGTSYGRLSTREQGRRTLRSHRRTCRQSSLTRRLA